MTDYYVYMMVLELVAIAHAVVTDPQDSRRLCKPGGVNLCRDRYQFVLSAMTCMSAAFTLQRLFHDQPRRLPGQPALVEP